jgi:hypothetical protein
MRSLTGVALASAILACSLGAQQNTPVAARQPKDPAAAVIQIGAGALGSAAIYASAFRAFDCDPTRDDTCTTESIIVGTAASVLVTSIATSIAAHYTRAPRSNWGAMLGVAVGTWAGWFLLTQVESDDENRSVLLIFPLTQAAGAVAGSRLFGK